MPEKLSDLSKLCIHTRTNKTWDLRKCVEEYSKVGVKGISVWRNVLEDQALSECRQILADHNMDVVSLVRGGFFASTHSSQRKEAINDNLYAIEEASSIGSPLLVLVCGADGKQSLEKSREQIKEGIHRILPEAEATGIRLAIEPLHPMYAGDRSAIVSMEQANSICEEINSEYLGVAVDVYHVWWDHKLEEEIRRCGKNENLFAFHICDWKVPTNDFLTDRGLMGEGCIDIPRIRSWVENAGFKGYNEVEIFSDKYWSMDQNRYLELIVQAYLNNV